MLVSFRFKPLSHSQTSKFQLLNAFSPSHPSSRPINPISYICLESIYFSVATSWVYATAISHLDYCNKLSGLYVHSWAPATPSLFSSIITLEKMETNHHLLKPKRLPNILISSPFRSQMRLPNILISHPSHHRWANASEMSSPTYPSKAG